MAGSGKWWVSFGQMLNDIYAANQAFKAKLSKKAHPPDQPVDGVDGGFVAPSPEVGWHGGSGATDDTVTISSSSSSSGPMPPLKPATIDGKDYYFALMYPKNAITQGLTQEKVLKDLMGSIGNYWKGGGFQAQQAQTQAAQLQADAYKVLAQQQQYQALSELLDEHAGDWEKGLFQELPPGVVGGAKALEMAFGSSYIPKGVVSPKPLRPEDDPSHPDYWPPGVFLR